METPGQWAQEFAGNFTPFWLDTAMIENGPMQTGNYFAGAAELVGGRTFPVSLWEQMRMEKAKAAEQEYGLQWEELNRLQQQNIINGDRYPAIGALQDQINEEMPLSASCQRRRSRCDYRCLLSPSEKAQIIIGVTMSGGWNLRLTVGNWMRLVTEKG